MPSRALRRLLLTLVLGVAAALAVSAQAFAAETHVFSAGKTFAATGKCEFAEPGGVAVDESTGDIFVYDRGINNVDWFRADGTCAKHRKTGKGESGEEEHEGVAVDNSGGPANGDVYVVNIEEGGVIKYEQEEKEGKPELKRIGFIKKFKNEEKEEFELEEIHGISVDASGNLWVYNGEVIDEFNNEGKFVAVVEVFAGSCSARPGFAVSGEADAFYVGRERENRAEECEEPTVIMKLSEFGEPPTELSFDAQLDLQPTTAVAVDRESGEVYLDNKTSISAYGANESFIERFGHGSSEGNLHESGGVAVNSATNEVFAVDAFEGRVVVFVPGSAGGGPAPEPTHPLPDNRAYEQVSPENKFGAAIYPISTQFGLVEASEDGNSLTYTASGPIVAAPPDNRAVEASQNLSRRASTGWGTESIGAPHGPVPNGAGKGQEYEFFTPKDLASAFLTPSQHGIADPHELLLAPEATENAPYKRTLTTPSTSCEPVPSTCYQALVSPNIPNNFSGPGPFGNLTSFVDATPDGQHAVIYSSAQLTSQPIGEKEGEKGKALYEWNLDGELQLASVLPEGEAGPPFEAKLGGGGQQFGGVMRHALSDDGSRVIFSAEMSVAEGGPLYLRDTAKGETLRLDKAQGGAPEPEHALALFQTASSDGTKIFFTDTAPLLPNSTSTPGFEAEEEQSFGYGDLYVCEIEEEEITGKLHCNLTDLTAKGEEGHAEAAAVQGVIGAADNGSSVYFVADGVYGESAGPGKCAPRNETEREEEVAGALPVRHCSLYVAQLGAEGWEEPKLVAGLTSEDQPDWLPITEKGVLGRVTSRVSPNGLHLAFMSSTSLTGYDNRATNPAAENARAEEVFTYDAETELVSCPSCNPSKARPNAVLAVKKGRELLVDRGRNWIGRWVAANIPGWSNSQIEDSLYQSRYLSDTGRLFFTSADALNEDDTNGVMDVYEFDPPGEGTCTSETGCIALISSGESPEESAFLDASTSGDDVFILTSQQLLKQDTDSGFDVYDARVCSPSSPCLAPPGEPTPPCGDEAGCKGGSAGVPALPPAPPTATIKGPGNKGTVQEEAKKPTPPPVVTHLTRAQKLKLALKKCNKIKKHKKRAACIRQAKKRYGAKKHKGKSSSHRVGR